MRCPTLKELPYPPEGKTGWPWTEESPRLPDTMPDGKSWPKISVVTPNYNYSQFIEETIRSVLLQGYPNLEYIVVDDASTDSSVEIIKKYEKWFTFFSKKVNGGQTNAINHGSRNISGQIIAYINSDDRYAIGAFAYVANWYISSPPQEWLVGACQFIDAQGEPLQVILPQVSSKLMFWIERPFFAGSKNCLACPQPSVFLKIKQWESTGYFDESFDFCFDQEYWIRLILRGYTSASVNKVLSDYRLHSVSKTISKTRMFLEEDLRIVHLYLPYLRFADRMKIRWYLGRFNCQERASKIWAEIEALPYRKKIWRILKESFLRPQFLIRRSWLGLIKRMLLRIC